jgi:hypothetical protein
MGILEKYGDMLHIAALLYADKQCDCRIKEIEFEMARTQKNKVSSSIGAPAPL